MKLQFFAVLMILSLSGLAQQSISFKNNNKLEGVNATFSETKYMGIDALMVVPTDAQTEARFVKIADTDFTNGVIELKLAGKRATSAGRNARGFVGFAFRVKEDNSSFECFYIRPTNGRANDQLRRNHSVQYISYPGFPWHKLRKDTPGKYESYSDLVEGEWTKMKIVVKDDKAQLYLHGNEQPTLLVNDLKLGADAKGAIGLWVGPGTEAYFADLKISK